ncbi:YjgB family protein [Sulfobacillus sp. DSM 109850]|uniref:YjgB family protein n=1 Tax=Sulfobacillus harzensis TaxID=2729629 RepID=A0A7Y0L0P6_9FIRM|nr:YjgB family protein [Sulfobacillus harzensis]
MSWSGKALGIPDGDQQSYYALEKVWGPGSHGTGVNGITYVTYGAHHAVVGFNEGVQLADVRSYSPDLHQITLADIETVLGKPDTVSHSAGSVIYAYNRGQYRLLWVFSESGSTVNHVDVQWPKGMVAPMAAE